MVRKEKISAADKGSILGRINVTTKIAGFAAVDYCIEAATENETIKLKILPDADRVLRPEAIIATNTSSISITRLAVATGLLHVRLIRADQPPAQWMSSTVEKSHDHRAILRDNAA